MGKKYCPNCLWLVSETMSWLWCKPCEILVYSSDVLLDSPNDVEWQKKYKFYSLARKYWIYYEFVEQAYQEFSYFFKM